jgi:hypothetical protein
VPTPDAVERADNAGPVAPLRYVVPTATGPVVPVAVGPGRHCTVSTSPLLATRPAGLAGPSNSTHCA